MPSVETTGQEGVVEVKGDVSELINLYHRVSNNEYMHFEEEIEQGYLRVIMQMLRNATPEEVEAKIADMEIEDIPARVRAFKDMLIMKIEQAEIMIKEETAAKAAAETSALGTPPVAA